MFSHLNGIWRTFKKMINITYIKRSIVQYEQFQSEQLKLRKEFNAYNLKNLFFAINFYENGLIAQRNNIIHSDMQKRE
jgi:hypothetical protein